MRVAEHLSGDPREAALDRFLADNPELEQLSARLATFSIFRALKVERVEIRHSNVLAWLLDPSESHRLGDVALRRILSNMLLESDATFGQVSPAHVELMSFTDVEIRREWRNIDLLLLDRKNLLAVVIENKVGGSANVGQLRRYAEALGKEEEFASFHVIPVMLTLLGDEATGDDEAGFSYVTYSHAQVLRVLEQIIEQRADQMTEPVAVFLQHYADSLRRLTMQDEGIRELCKQIYRRHREAINLIVEYGQESVFEGLAEGALRDEGDHEILCTGSRAVWFLPSSWKSWVPENSVRWSHLSRPVSITARIGLSSRRDKIYIILEMCEMDDPESRLAAVEALSGAGFKLIKKAFRKEAVYSRFGRITRKVTDASDPDEVHDAIAYLLRRAAPDFERAAKALRCVFR